MTNQALGEFEHLVLLAIVREGERAHGAAIRRCLEERAGRGASFGAIYSTLRRLEAKGWIVSERRQAAHDAGERDRKYVRLTPAGREALAATGERLRRMAEGLDMALGS